MPRNSLTFFIFALVFLLTFVAAFSFALKCWYKPGYQFSEDNSEFGQVEEHANCNEGLVCAKIACFNTKLNDIYGNNVSEDVRKGCDRPLSQDICDAHCAMSGGHGQCVYCADRDFCNSAPATPRLIDSSGAWICLTLLISLASFKLNCFIMN